MLEVFVEDFDLLFSEFKALLATFLVNRLQPHWVEFVEKEAVGQRAEILLNERRNNDRVGLLQVDVLTRIEPLSHLVNHLLVRWLPEYSDRCRTLQVQEMQEALEKQERND